MQLQLLLGPCESAICVISTMIVTASTISVTVAIMTTKTKR